MSILKIGKKSSVKKRFTFFLEFLEIRTSETKFDKSSSYAFQFQRGKKHGETPFMTSIDGKMIRFNDNFNLFFATNLACGPHEKYYHSKYVKISVFQNSNPMKKAKKICTFKENLAKYASPEGKDVTKTVCVTLNRWGKDIKLKMIVSSCLSGDPRKSIVMNKIFTSRDFELHKHQIQSSDDAHSESAESEHDLLSTVDVVTPDENSQSVDDVISHRHVKTQTTLSLIGQHKQAFLYSEPDDEFLIQPLNNSFQSSGLKSQSNSPRSPHSPRKYSPRNFSSSTPRNQTQKSPIYNDHNNHSSDTGPTVPSLPDLSHSSEDNEYAGNVESISMEISDLSARSSEITTDVDHTVHERNTTQTSRQSDLQSKQPHTPNSKLDQNDTLSSESKQHATPDSEGETQSQGKTDVQTNESETARNLGVIETKKVHRTVSSDALGIPLINFELLKSQHESPVSPSPRALENLPKWAARNYSPAPSELKTRRPYRQTLVDAYAYVIYFSHGKDLDLRYVNRMAHFCKNIIYVGKGKPSNPYHEHLNENPNQGLSHLNLRLYNMHKANKQVHKQSLQNLGESSNSDFTSTTKNVYRAYLVKLSTSELAYPWTEAHLRASSMIAALTNSTEYWPKAIKHINKFKACPVIDNVNLLHNADNGRHFSSVLKYELIINGVKWLKCIYSKVLLGYVEEINLAKVKLKQGTTSEPPTPLTDQSRQKFTKTQEESRLLKKAKNF